MPTVATPRIPITTITATMIRIILRALLPPVGAGATDVAAGAAGPPDTTAPHLLQNFVPGLRVAPHELQNAINHLPCECWMKRRREYTADQGFERRAQRESPTSRANS